MELSPEMILSLDQLVSSDECVFVATGIRLFFQSNQILQCLEKEFQSRNYDALVARTTIIFTRYNF